MEMLSLALFYFFIYLFIYLFFFLGGGDTYTFILSESHKMVKPKQLRYENRSSFLVASLWHPFTGKTLSVLAWGQRSASFWDRVALPFYVCGKGGVAPKK